MTFNVLALTKRTKFNFRTFPWIVDIYNLSPFYFYKVIELLIRAEEGLSRDVVKHLNHVRGF